MAPGRRGAYGQCNQLTTSSVRARSLRGHVSRCRALPHIGVNRSFGFGLRFPWASELRHYSRSTKAARAVRALMKAPLNEYLLDGDHSYKAEAYCLLSRPVLRLAAWLPYTTSSRTTPLIVGPQHVCVVLGRALRSSHTRGTGSTSCWPGVLGAEAAVGSLPTGLDSCAQW